MTKKFKTLTERDLCSVLMSDEEILSPNDLNPLHVRGIKSRNNNHMKPSRLKSVFPYPLLLSLCIFSTLFPTKQNQSIERRATPTIKSALVQAQTPAVDRCKNLKTVPAIFGITITDLSRANAAKDVLRSLAADNATIPVVVRIVFDPIKKKEDFEDQLNIYGRQVAELKDGTNICLMGTIADSFSMHTYLPDHRDKSWPADFRNYEGWTRRLVAKMGGMIDIWEVGNEVNGEWYGWEDKKYKKKGEEDSKQDPKRSEKRKAMRDRIKRELSAAFEAVHDVRPQALRAITLLYNADQANNKCTEFSEYKMNEWAGTYLTPEVREGVDFVFLSYYENPQDCSQVTRDPAKLWDVLVSLRRQFTGDETVFGFGEISYKATCYRSNNEVEISDKERINNAACQSGQRIYVDNYYQTLDRGLSAVVGANTPPPDVKPIKFVGGYFYWYFLQDMVLSNNKEATNVLTALRTARNMFRKDGQVTPPSVRGVQ